MQKRLGILRGGTGKNYHASLRKGGEILSHITEHLADKYKAIDILIDKEGVWHMNGLPVRPGDLMHRIDAAWNTAHPEHSAVLKNLSIPYVGPDHFHSILEESRDMLRAHMRKIGLDMPRAMVIPLYQEDFDGPKEEYALRKAHEIHRKFGAPWTVKSFTEDRNMGIHLAKTFPELVGAIEDGVNHKKSILVEEFISGKVATTHAVPEFRNETVYVFPLGNTFGAFSTAEKEILSEAVRKIYTHLGEPHYLKADFVVDTRGKVYLLGIELHPDLKPESHFSQVCGDVGAKADQVVEHILRRVF